MNGAAAGVGGGGGGSDTGALATETIRKAVVQLYFSSTCDAQAREEANHLSVLKSLFDITAMFLLLNLTSQLNS